MHLLKNNSNCGNCHKCIKEELTTSDNVFMPSRMILCPKCGNKRCPKASDHQLPCTKSNKPNQKGSVYDDFTYALRKLSSPVGWTAVGKTELIENTLKQAGRGGLGIMFVDMKSDMSISSSLKFKSRRLKNKHSKKIRIKVKN